MYQGDAEVEPEALAPLAEKNRRRLNHDSLILVSNPSLMKFLTQSVLFLVIEGVHACFVPFNVEGQDLYHVLTEATMDVNSMKESLECPLH